MSRRITLFLLYAITAITILLIYETNWIQSSKKRKFLHAIPDPDLNSFANIPRIYFDDNGEPLKKFNGTCAIFPKRLDLRFTTDPWQIQKTSEGTFHLFSAHFDDRDGRGKIRILTMFDRVDSKRKFYCQIWNRDKLQPEIVETETLVMLWLKEWGGHRNGLAYPYLITCPLSAKGSKAISVSLVEKPCKSPTNKLELNYPTNRGRQKNFVVCVKGLNFPFEDISDRLIEWIELVFILGAEKISFYQFQVHPRIDRVLRYYRQMGRMEVVPFTLIGEVPNSPFLQSKYLHERKLERRLQEIIPYNDCLYRHLKEFKFVVLLDVDEVIVPLHGTWGDLMEDIQDPNITSFLTNNVYFRNSASMEELESIPSNFYMLQHVFRLKNYSDEGYHVKGFHSTGKVVGLHNRYPFKCIQRCRDVNIEPEKAHLQHYRDSRVKGEINSSDRLDLYVSDIRIWNFKEELIENVQKTVKEIGYNKN